MDGHGQRPHPGGCLAVAVAAGEGAVGSIGCSHTGTGHTGCCHTGGLPVGLLLVVLLLLLVLPAPASPTTHIMCTTPLVAPAPACLVPNLGIRGGGRAGVGCLGVRALLGSRWLPLRREGDPANSISIKHVIQNATEA